MCLKCKLGELKDVEKVINDFCATHVKAWLDKRIKEYTTQIEDIEKAEMEKELKEMEK